MAFNPCPLCGLPSKLKKIKSHNENLYAYQCELHGRFCLTEFIENKIHLPDSAELRLKVEQKVLKQVSNQFAFKDALQAVVVIHEKDL
ncbi:hypothetical protein RHD99_10985 [Buttiauxella selenatireducens]|uniref:Uncharacterized protein n=1 Tax=Buttiauxella selenatireducens TaxID=3073902 RepID=A0ABY9SG29_9ENTR|nr:hypothetical protein [Buttiauxella sp. R73]WMY76407.1 hypothetical protein RHD99_10985 [Buttiauxella sp. R73]